MLFVTQHPVRRHCTIIIRRAHTPSCVASQNLWCQNQPALVARKRKWDLFLKSTVCRVVRWKLTDVSEEHSLHLQGRRLSRTRNQCESMWQAEQPASRNFGLYRKKQERNGRVELSSRWLTRRTEWNRQHPLGVTRPPSEPVGDKNRISGWPLRGAVLLV
jgi:hypothetical protein